jgi:hypothetical protein
MRGRRRETGSLSELRFAFAGLANTRTGSHRLRPGPDEKARRLREAPPERGNHLGPVDARDDDPPRLSGVMSLDPWRARDRLPPGRRPGPSDPIKEPERAPGRDTTGRAERDSGRGTQRRRLRALDRDAERVPDG